MQRVEIVKKRVEGLKNLKMCFFGKHIKCLSLFGEKVKVQKHEFYAFH